MENDYLARIRIDEPITFIMTGIKNPKKNYLTNNLFYSGRMHFATRMKLVNEAKKWLRNKIVDWEKENGKIPQLKRMSFWLIHSRKNGSYDLDNKAGFWKKIALDLFKTPTERQILSTKKYKGEIVTMGLIKDDKADVVWREGSEHRDGENYIEIVIEGVIDKKIEPKKDVLLLF